jgi:hypothetical protein
MSEGQRARLTQRRARRAGDHKVFFGDNPACLPGSKFYQEGINPMLTLEQASIIVDKGLEKGRQLGFKPLTVVVLDAGGQSKAMKREDG